MIQAFRPTSSADGVSWDLKDLYAGPDDPGIERDLKSALEENKVASVDQDDLFALLGPMHDDVVEVKPREKPAGKK